MKVPRIHLTLSLIALCLAANVLLPCSNATQAKTSPRQAHQQSGEGEGVVGQAEELLKLSARQNLDNHALALDTARRALALWQTTADDAGIARAYAHIARYHVALSDLAEASENYGRALQLWRDQNKPGEQANVLTSLGFIEARKGEWANAISLLTEAQALVAELDDPYQMGRITSGLAYVFNESGLPEKALAQYQKALDYYQLAATPREAALTVLEIGSSHYLQGNHTEALAHFRQALASFPPGSLDAAHCRHYIGRVHVSTGEHDAALQHLQSVLPVYQRAGNLSEAAEVQGLIGQIYQQQGRLEPARERYLQALGTFTRLSDRVNEAAVSFALGRVELKAGNYVAAEGHLRRSIELTEHLRLVPISSDLTAALSATIHERYEKYVECLMRRHEAESSRGFDVRAFETSEQARARSLTELLRATQTFLLPGLDPELAQREKSLRQSLRVKWNHKVAMLGGEYRKEDLAALDAELVRLEAQYEQVSTAIHKRHPAYESMTRPAGWDLRRIREQIVADDQTALLEFALGENKSYVWAVTRDRFSSYELPPGAQINEAVERVYKALSTPPAPDSEAGAMEALHELSRMILSPLASELNKSRIIVVADGALHYIPFQILPSPRSGGSPLIADHEVVNAPSASVLGELRQETTRRRPAARLLAAFGNPAFLSGYARHKQDDGGTELAALRRADNLRQALRDLGLNDETFDPAAIKELFYAGKELANLKDVAAGGEPLLASGFAATRERLLSTDLSQYAILHFATHGFLDSKRPENSGLVLSTINPEGEALDGFVGLQHIYGLRAPVNLVVLSACQTALGKDVRGEGLIGLTRGFMYAGASGVVASLWKVDDEATAELMRQFYANMLHKGQPPGEALRAAQNSIRQRPEWRSPYYWAAFTIQGEYRQIIKPAAASNFSARSGATLAVSALAGALCWYFRRRLLSARRARDYSTLKK
jgi:CHAT domain-containing protein/predicted negative regulator of RcsB-dependent stress response